MSTIQDLFQQAQLAEAAYADFSEPGVSTKDALIAEGMIFAQASSFVTQWRVVNQQPKITKITQITGSGLKFDIPKAHTFRKPIILFPQPFSPLGSL